MFDEGLKANFCRLATSLEIAKFLSLLTEDLEIIDLCCWRCICCKHFQGLVSQVRKLLNCCNFHNASTVDSA